MICLRIFHLQIHLKFMIGFAMTPIINIKKNFIARIKANNSFKFLYNIISFIMKLFA